MTLISADNFLIIAFYSDLGVGYKYSVWQLTRSAVIQSSAVGL